MAFYAQSTTTSDGVTATKSVPFPYLQKAHVKVYLGGYEEEEAYTGVVSWISPSVIALDPIPANGVTVQVRRETPLLDINAMLQAIPYTHQRGSLDALQINVNNKASLYRDQEGADAFARYKLGAPLIGEGITGTTIALVATQVFNAIELRPEDYYLPLIDGNNWSPAFVRLEAARQELLSGTREIIIKLSKRVYGCKQALSFGVDILHSLNIQGAGWGLDGSDIRAITGYTTGSTVPFFQVIGLDGVDTNGRTVLTNFGLRNEVGALSDIAFQAKDLKQPVGPSLMEGIYIFGWRVGHDVQNARLFDFRAIYVWNEGIANGIGFRHIVDGDDETATYGTGDVNYWGCQHAGGNPLSGALTGTVNIHLEALDGGGCRGIRFNAFIGYNADFPVRLVTDTDSQAAIADIWFSGGTQFDRVKGGFVDIQANGSGSNYGSIFSIFFDHVYWSNTNVNPVLGNVEGDRGDGSFININSGNVAQLHVTHCVIQNFARTLKFKGCVDLHLDNVCTYGFGDSDDTNDAVITLDDCHGVYIDGLGTFAPIGTTNNAIAVETTCTDVHIGTIIGAIKAVRDPGTILRKRLIGRPQVDTAYLPIHADNTAAAALPVGDFYRTSTGQLMVRY